MFNESAEGTLYEDIVSEAPGAYGVRPSDKLALVASVKKENIIDFENRTATVYVSGHRFPTSIELKDLTFFVPCIKGKGIRDLYKITKIFIKEYSNSRKGQHKYRLAFDIEFVMQMFDEYEMCKLDIWNTFTVSKLNEII